MNDKLQAKVSAYVFTIASILVYLSTLPPEQQDSVLGPIVSLIPLTWRPEVGLILKAISSAAGFWGIYKAAHSGPQVPPVDVVPPATKPASDSKV